MILNYAKDFHDPNLPDFEGEKNSNSQILKTVFSAHQKI
jgi:hypothetical protein